MTRTTEQLRERIRGIEITLQYKNWEAVKADLECLKELLAVREAQPVAWITKPTFEDNDGTAIVFMTSANLTGCIPLFTAPPAPAVPDVAAPNGIEILASTYAPRGVTYQWDADECNAATDSWNACRAAMLNHSGDVAEKVPAGFKLVPVEPTEDMVAAAMMCDDVEFNSDETFCVNFGNIYIAMLAAAPTPTKAEAQQISPIKPVLFANDFDLKNGWADHADTVTEMRQGYTVPLYAAPLLLDEIKDHKFNSGDKADDYHAGYQSGWNEYRDAIISAMNSAENGDVPKD